MCPFSLLPFAVVATVVAVAVAAVVAAVAAVVAAAVALAKWQRVAAFLFLRGAQLFA